VIDRSEAITLGSHREFWIGVQVPAQHRLFPGHLRGMILRPACPDDPSEDHMAALQPGDVTPGVVRLGGVVRRPRQLNTSAVHAFLAHLADVGFEGAPRVRDLTRTHEYLSFVPGSVAHRPYPDWLPANELLVDLAVRLAEFHRAAAGFVLPPGIRWEVPDASTPAEPLELVGHCDLTPENVVVQDGAVVGFIDFDLARPTTRLFDVVTTLRHWAPIADPADLDACWSGANAVQRIVTFCDAYGLSGLERSRFVGVADRRFDASWEAMRARAGTLGGGWARLWQEGAGDRIRSAQRWLRAHADEIERALAG
jgi:hypothetical protein